MKKRNMRKYIPKNTDYCGSCKNRIYIGRFKDFLICPKEVGSTEMIEVETKHNVYKCRYKGVTTMEDLCFEDGIKICGEKEGEKYINNIFDEKEMKELCRDLDIEIVEGINTPIYNDKEMSKEDIKNIFLQG